MMGNPSRVTAGDGAALLQVARSEFDDTEAATHAAAKSPAPASDALEEEEEECLWLDGREPRATEEW